MVRFMTVMIPLINFLNYFSHAMTKQFREEGYFGLGFRSFNYIMVGFMIVGMLVWDSSYLAVGRKQNRIEARASGVRPYFLQVPHPLKQNH